MCASHRCKFARLSVRFNHNSNKPIAKVAPPESDNCLCAVVCAVACACVCIAGTCKLRKYRRHLLTVWSQLQVLDETAFTLCKENRIPVLVFDLHAPGNILRAVQGRPNLGTVVDSEPDQPHDIAPHAGDAREQRIEHASSEAMSLAQLERAVEWERERAHL